MQINKTQFIKDVLEVVKPEIANLITLDKTVQQAWLDDLDTSMAESGNDETYEVSSIESKTGNPVLINLIKE